MTRLVKIILVAVFLIFVAGTVWAFFALKEPVKAPTTNTPTKNEEKTTNNTPPAAVAPEPAQVSPAPKTNESYKPRTNKTYTITEYIYEIIEVTEGSQSTSSSSQSSSGSASAEAHAEAYAW